VVLSRAEVKGLFDAMTGTHKLMAQLLYGAGMRLLALLRLHVMARPGLDVRSPLDQSYTAGAERFLLPSTVLHPPSSASQ
jgi:hypothetical protein